jgi:protein-tyrosine-phosphatase
LLRFARNDKGSCNGKGVVHFTEAVRCDSIAVGVSRTENRAHLCVMLDNKQPSHILFVCDANTCRSPMAEAMLKKMLADFAGEPSEIRVSSAGVAPRARDGSDITLDVKWLLQEEGISVENFRSRDLKRHQELLTEADLVLTMSKEQKERVRLLPQTDGKGIYTLKEYVGEAGDIADPWGDDAYAPCRDEIKRCLQKLVIKLFSGTY